MYPGVSLVYRDTAIHGDTAYRMYHPPSGAHAAGRTTAAAMRHGWSRAHGVEPRPGSCEDHPHTPVACIGARLRVRCLAKFPSLRCPSAVLSARPVCVVFRDSNAVGRRKLSVVSSRYSYLVMLSSTRHLVAAARPAGAVGAIGRFATLVH